MLKLKSDELVRQIEALIKDYPEMLEDDILRADMIEAETDAVSFIRQLEKKRNDAKVNMEVLMLYINQLKNRFERFRKQEEAMRTLMFRLLQAGQLRRLVLPEATLSIASAPARVLITNEDELPDAYCRIKREPDKDRIKFALITAAVVPGAELSNSPDYLRIKVG